MQENMKLRKYCSVDCEALAMLFYDTVHHVNSKDYTAEQLNAWATGEIDTAEWNKLYTKTNTIVAVIGDEIVGFGNMDETGYLDMLYVHKDFQGQGIASAICDRLEKESELKEFTTFASITAKPFLRKEGIFQCLSRKWKGKGYF